MSTKKSDPRKLYRRLPESSHTETKQIDKFREAARELETDESEAHFDALVKKIAKSDRKAAIDQQIIAEAREQRARDGGKNPRQVKKPE